jgi:hypothetical protein
MWHKIWIRDIKGILMMLKRFYPENGAREELPTIKPLTSRFPLSDLDLDFLAQKFQIKLHKQCKMVHCAYSFYYILLVSALVIP